jgi:hypothetical protein
MSRSRGSKTRSRSSILCSNEVRPVRLCETEHSMSRLPWALAFFPLFLLSISGCSQAPKKQAKIYAAGEKATVGQLSYNVVDTEIRPSLGDDPTNPRAPQNRFYLIEVAVSNGGNEDASIPGMSLVDDSGQTYQEVPDGTGVPNWLGVVRKVSPAQTEEGNVLFDAPPKHYRLRLTDEGDDDISIDIPLNFIHDDIRNMDQPNIDIPQNGPVAPKK